MGNFILRVVFWYLHREYAAYSKPIFYVKGTGKDYPKYLLYTEDENVYKRMDSF